MSDFQLDRRLAADTILIGSYNLSLVLLMNDSRWPWAILVPRVAGAEELHMLPIEDQAQIAAETSMTASALKAFLECEKINSAAIGNIVRQLHIHIIARNEDDPNWPGPVWGFGERQEYAPEALGKTVLQFQKMLSVTSGFVSV